MENTSLENDKILTPLRKGRRFSCYRSLNKAIEKHRELYGLKLTIKRAVKLENYCLTVEQMKDLNLKLKYGELDYHCFIDTRKLGRPGNGERCPDLVRLKLTKDAQSLYIYDSHDHNILPPVDNVKKEVSDGCENNLASSESQSGKEICHIGDITVTQIIPDVAPFIPLVPKLEAVDVKPDISSSGTYVINSSNSFTSIVPVQNESSLASQFSSNGNNKSDCNNGKSPQESAGENQKITVRLKKSQCVPNEMVVVGSQRDTEEQESFRDIEMNGVKKTDVQNAQLHKELAKTKITNNKATNDLVLENQSLDISKKIQGVKQSNNSEVRSSNLNGANKPKTKTLDMQNGKNVSKGVLSSCNEMLKTVAKASNFLKSSMSGDRLKKDIRQNNRLVASNETLQKSGMVSKWLETGSHNSARLSDSRCNFIAKLGTNKQVQSQLPPSSKVNSMNQKVTSAVNNSSKIANAASTESLTKHEKNASLMEEEKPKSVHERLGIVNLNSTVEKDGVRHLTKKFKKKAGKATDRMMAHRIVKPLPGALDTELGYGEKQHLAHGVLLQLLRVTSQLPMIEFSHALDTLEVLTDAFKLGQKVSLSIRHDHEELTHLESLLNRTYSPNDGDYRVSSTTEDSHLLTSQLDGQADEEKLIAELNSFVEKENYKDRNLSNNSPNYVNSTDKSLSDVNLNKRDLPQSAAKRKKRKV